MQAEESNETCSPQPLFFLTIKIKSTSDFTLSEAMKNLEIGILRKLRMIAR